MVVLRNIFSSTRGNNIVRLVIFNFLLSFFFTQPIALLSGCTIFYRIPCKCVCMLCVTCAIGARYARRAYTPHTRFRMHAWTMNRVLTVFRQFIIYTRKRDNTHTYSSLREASTSPKTRALRLESIQHWRATQPLPPRRETAPPYARSQLVLHVSGKSVRSYVSFYVSYDFNRI